MARRKKKNSGATAAIVIIVVAVLIAAVVVFALALRNEVNTSGSDDTAGINEVIENTSNDTAGNENSANVVGTADSQTTDTTDEVTEEPAPEEHIEITDITVNDSADLPGGGKAKISITAPKVKSTTYAENTELFNEIITTEIESFKNEFAQAITAHSAEGDAEVNYHFEMTYELKKASDGVVSVMLIKYSHLGGAHGGNAYKSVNFDLNSGMRVDLQYVTGVPSDEYAPFIKENILNKMKQNPDNYYSVDDDVLDDCFDDSQFLVTESGIIVFFQEYDIAPYAAGLQTFEIPYNELIELSSY